MKKLLLILMMTQFAFASFAQSEKYLKAMTDKVLILDTTRNAETLQSLANSFERIGDAEKTQWLPYYYAALSQLNAGYSFFSGSMGGKADKIDPIADRAEQLLIKAESLSSNNDELFILKKMVASLRMMADPMTRYMKYGPLAQQALEQARQLNPENPRIYLLEGQDKYFTPEQFGGSKEEAKKLFTLAMQKYEAIQLKSPIDPHWGKGTTEYFLKLSK